MNVMLAPDVVEALGFVTNRSAYIEHLIRKDMECRKRAGVNRLADIHLGQATAANALETK